MKPPCIETHNVKLLETLEFIKPLIKGKIFKHLSLSKPDRWSKQNYTFEDILYLNPVTMNLKLMCSQQ
jgi:hypothetical protein